MTHTFNCMVIRDACVFKWGARAIVGMALFCAGTPLGCGMDFRQA